MQDNKKELEKLEQEFINSFINLRKRYDLTQQEMAVNTGIIRETIARIETGKTSPQIRTLIKLLEPLGYTVKIVPKEQKYTITPKKYENN